MKCFHCVKRFSSCLLLLAFAPITGQSLIPVFKDNLSRFPKWGYIDEKGTVIVEPKYNSAGFFSEGLSAVKIRSNPNEESAIAYIDTTGKEVIPANKNWEIGIDFKEGFAVIRFKNGEYAVINKRGDVLGGKTFEKCLGFSGGFCAVKIGKKWGFINRAGIQCIKPQFTAVASFSEGLACVREKGKLFGYIDTAGNYIVKPKYSNATRFNNGYAVVSVDSLGKKEFEESFYHDIYTDHASYISKYQFKKNTYIARGTLKQMSFFIESPIYAEKDFFCGNTGNRGIAFNEAGDTLFKLKQSGYTLVEETYYGSGKTKQRQVEGDYQFFFPYIEGKTIVCMDYRFWEIVDKKGNTVKTHEELFPDDKEHVYTKTIGYSTEFFFLDRSMDDRSVFEVTYKFNNKLEKCKLITIDGTTVFSSYYHLLQLQNGIIYGNEKIISDKKCVIWNDKGDTLWKSFEN